MSKIRRREDPLNFFSRQVVSFDNPPIYLGAIMAGYEIKHSNSIRTKEGGGRRGFSRVESETTTSSKYHHKCDRETKYGILLGLKPNFNEVDMFQLQREK